VKCAVVAPPDPSYSDSPSALKAAADVFEQAKLLLAGRKQRDARIVELKAANSGCSDHSSSAANLPLKAHATPLSRGA
jgi:hypothetical protein